MGNTIDDGFGRRIDRFPTLIIALFVLGVVLQFGILTLAEHRQNEFSQRVLNRDSLRSLNDIDAHLVDTLLALGASANRTHPSPTAFSQEATQLLQQIDVLKKDKALANLDATRDIEEDAHLFLAAGSDFIAAPEGSDDQRRATVTAAQTLTRLRANVAGLRRVLYARNNSIYIEERRDHTFDMLTLSCGSVFLSGALVLLAIVSSRRLRKELYLRRDRDQVLKDMAYSEITLVWETDAENRLTTLVGAKTNPSMPDPEELLGLTVAEVFGDYGFDFNGSTNPLETIAGRAPIRDAVYRRKLPDGSTIWRSISGAPVFDEAGRYAGYRGTAIDITSQKRYERELRGAIDAFRDFASASSDDFWDVNAQGIIEWIGGDGTGPATLRSAYLHRSVRDVLDSQRVKFAPGPSLEECIAHGRAFRDLELEIDNLRGTDRVWIRMSGVPHYDDAGAYAGMRLATAVITAAKRASLELEEKQRQLELLLSSFPVMAIRRRPHSDNDDGDMLYMSNSAEALLGRPAEDYLGSNPRARYPDHIHADDLADARAATRRTIVDGTPYQISYRLLAADGTTRWMSSRGIRALDAHGEPIIESFAIDVTQQIEREQALRKSEAELAAVVHGLERSRDAVLIADAESKVTYANAAFLRLVDADSPGDVIGRDVKGLAQVEGTTIPELDVEVSRDLSESGHSVNEFTIVTSKGNRREIQSRSTSLDGGRVISIYVDLTEQRLFQAEREQRERWLATVVAALDSSRDRIAIEDSKRQIIYANRALRELAKARSFEVIGARLDDVFPYNRAGKAGYDAARQLVAEHGAWRKEVQFDRPTGETVIYDARLVKTPENGILFVGTDITDSKARERREVELQTRLAQAEKMEALGRLAGGIAHDFNNILGAIRSFGDLLAEGLERGSRYNGYATRIVAACDRAADLVRQILAFTRAKDAPRELVAVSELIGEVAAMVSGKLGDKAFLTLSNLSPDAVVVANSGQLTQVLLNLIVNARDALPGGEGEVFITNAEVVVPKDQSPPFERGFFAAGETDDGFVIATDVLKADTLYLRISVSDNGTGIPAKIAQKIFDPFFTTKDKRSGSGLGLSVVSSVIAAHQGVIAVQSREGSGTAFHIYLPAHKANVRPERGGKVQVRNRATDVDIRGEERILIVDDEVDMADALSYSLTNLGYETAPVYSPVEALEIFKEDPAAWDIVITDQAMPEMRGLELIRKMKFIRPDLKAILCTGFSDHATEQSAIQEGADWFVTKPLDSESLALAIRGLMSRGSVQALQ